MEQYIKEHGFFGKSHHMKRMPKETHNPHNKTILHKGHRMREDLRSDAKDQYRNYCEEEMKRSFRKH